MNIKRTTFLAINLCIAFNTFAQKTDYSFGFENAKGSSKDAISITNKVIYNTHSGYGYDLLPAPKGNAPFYFSVNEPDGNYLVTITLGSKNKAGSTTVRGESRRLFYENIPTNKGEFKTVSFVINKRDTKISDGVYVKIKKREEHKLNWDDKLTLEFNGEAPCVAAVNIKKVNNVTTLFLCGNSTVVDQDNEPWASWGQMIPRFFDENICVANYAESGETASTFLAVGRYAKALTQMKPGDYVFMEFGHNDQKQRGKNAGPYKNFWDSLTEFVRLAREKGATPVFVTPTQRRTFVNGKIKDSHGEYPQAIRNLAERLDVQVIDLNEMTRTLYEALGEENSVKAFVHYPANTYPNQKEPLADNTHFNPYGAYQIAKCVIEGMKRLSLPIVQDLRKDYHAYDPAHPDDLKSFHWNNSPFTEIEKPDGN